MNNNKYPWYLNWFTIIMALYLFWPVGIALIILRTKRNKGGVFSGITNKKIYLITGALLVLFGFTRFDSSSTFALFMIVGGIVLIYYANTLAKKAQRNKKYIDMIINQRETSIDKISGMLNVKYDTVVKELKILQTLGVLNGAIINETTHSITMPYTQQSHQTSQFNQNSMNPNLSTNNISQQAPMSETACPGCGAKYTGQKGSVCTCDYCDSKFVI